MQNTLKFVLAAALVAMPVHAGVVGYVVPAPPLTAQRVAGNAEWQAYYDRSQAILAEEKAVFSAEKITGPTKTLISNSAGLKTMPLNREPKWYASAEARHVADVIVSFQTPSGGWCKNAPRDGDVRQPGQFYDAVHSEADAGRVNWGWVGTIDNSATTTEMRFLALVAFQTPGAQGDSYRASFLRGVDYMLNAQFPNGGWPQIYPLEGSYHDAITYNDDAMIDTITLLSNVASGEGDYAFAPDAVRGRAKIAVDNALDCILKTQLKIDGRLTIWGQQNDPLTLTPVGARNYEPGSLASSESAGLLIYLMTIKNPSPEVIASVKAGVVWLKSAALHDVAWAKGTDGSQLVSKPGAPQIWSRYYSMVTEKPIFGDRDRSVHDDVMDISPERRNGYSWYNSTAQKALDAYDKWTYK